MLLAGVKNWLARPLLPEDMTEETDPGEVPGIDPRDIAWPAERIELAGQLWGEGYILPGGEEETLRLARSLGLSADSTLLLLGCGPGGASRSVAGRLGVWVSGFEADPDLASAGASLCALSGLGHRADVCFWNPNRPDFQHRHYHHALALEPMRIASPETVLAGISLALRPGGQLGLLEMVATQKPDPAAPEFTRWMELEGRTAMPPPETAITRAFGRLGFETRATEDVSQRHLREIARGWREIVRTLNICRPGPAAAARLVREGELWLLRARLLRSGRLRLIRWHAVGRRGAAAA